MVSILELPEYHPIVQMLWDKSRMAAKGMEEEESSNWGFMEQGPTAATTPNHLGGTKIDGYQQDFLGTKIEEATSMSI